MGATLAASPAPAVDGTLPVSDEEAEAAGERARSVAAGTDALPVIDRASYAVAGELARGGLGRILRARDRRLDRTVALKETLRAGPDLAARFVREAMVTARLQHPAIVPVYEAGRWPSGEPFYAMKLVSGRPLDAVVAEATTLSARLALLPNVIAIADALAYAHQERIIHRDLKPQNVLVGAFGETVVIDWGLAKDLSDTGGEAEGGPFRAAAAPGETVAGAVMGTPAFMPPEQARGEPVDERADVYALGALLHHVLCGEPPYTGKTVQAILDAVIAGPPPSLEQRHPDIPADLAAIVTKAMARDPAERYPTAAEMATELRRYQTGQLVGAHRYSTWALIRRWIRRHRAAVAAAAAVLLFLVAGTAFYLHRERGLRADAERARDQARRSLASSYLEQGRNHMVAGDPLRALPFLSEACSLGDQDFALRLMLGQALAEILPVERELPDTTAERAWFVDRDRRLATIGRPYRLWDVDTGRLVTTFRAYPGDPGSGGWLSVSEDQAVLATLAGAPVAGVSPPAGSRFAGGRLSGDGKHAVLEVRTGEELRAALWRAGRADQLVDLRPIDGFTQIEVGRRGRFAVFSSSEETELRDLERNATVLSLPGRMAAELSPGEDHLVARSETAVAAYDTGSGSQLWEVALPGKAQWSPLDWTIGGAMLVTCAEERAMLLDPHSGALLGELPAPACEYHLARAALVLATSRAVWRLRPLEQIGELPDLGLRPVGDLGLSDDGRQLYTRIAGLIAAWNVDGGGMAGGWHRPVLGVSSDAHWAVARTSPERLALLRLEPGRLRYLFPPGRLSPSTRWVAGSTADERLALWEPGRLYPVRRLRSEVADQPIAVFDPAERRIAIVDRHGEGVVSIVDLRGGQAATPLRMQGIPDLLRWRPDGAQIAIAATEYRDAKLRDPFGTLTLWADTGRLVGGLELAAGVKWMDYRPDGARIVALLDDGTVVVVDPDRLAVVTTRDHGRYGIGAIAMDPGTGRIAATHGDRIEIWDSDLRGMVASLSFPGGAGALDWTVAGLLAASQTDIRVFDVDAGRILGHVTTPGLATVSLSPDGQLLLAGDERRTGLWEVRTGRALAQLQRRDLDITGQPVIYRGFSADSSTAFFLVREGRSGTPGGAEDGPSAMIGWDVRPESRAAPEVARLVADKVPWRLEGGRLVEVK